MDVSQLQVKICDADWNARKGGDCSVEYSTNQINRNCLRSVHRSGFVL